MGFRRQFVLLALIALGCGSANSTDREGEVRDNDSSVLDTLGSTDSVVAVDSVVTLDSGTASDGAAVRDSSGSTLVPPLEADAILALCDESDRCGFSLSAALGGSLDCIATVIALAGPAYIYHEPDRPPAGGSHYTEGGGGDYVRSVLACVQRGATCAALRSCLAGGRPASLCNGNNTRACNGRELVRCQGEWLTPSITCQVRGGRCDDSDGSARCVTDETCSGSSVSCDNNALSYCLGDFRYRQTCDRCLYNGADGVSCIANQTNVCVRLRNGNRVCSDCGDICHGSTCEGMSCPVAEAVRNSRPL